MPAPEEVLFNKLGQEPGAKFALGRLVATPGALRELTHEDMLAGLSRHARGDWGDVGTEDYAANESALVESTRLFSVYRSARGVKFWVITEADRSSTCVLLPREY